MRVAICLYGRFNNRLSSTAGAEGFAKLSKLIRQFPTVEYSVYAYSNDVESAADIKNLYRRAEQVVIEEPLDFDPIIKGRGIFIEQFDVPSGFRTFANALSFFYSRKRSIQLMLDSRQHFDWVIVSRFDVAQLDRFNGRQREHVGEIGFNLTLQAGQNYAANWSQHNHGYADQWFILSLEDAQLLGTMFDQALTYLEEDSPYLQFIQDGVLHSNQLDEFSNERFQRPAKNLESIQKTGAEVKLAKGKALDVHLMHKYFFLTSGLYFRSSFSGGIDALPLILYSHSDYQDLWEPFGALLHRNSNIFSKHYLASNESNKILAGFELLPYSESSSYTDRLIQSLVQLDEQFIFFMHEDMLITGRPNLRLIQDAIELVRDRGYDYYRFSSGGLAFHRPILGKPGSSKFLNAVSPWIFSIQPSIWKVDSLLRLLSNHRGQGIWEFEASAQKTFKRLGFKGAFASRRGPKRGLYHFDSPDFPYIATAIVKGKWNTTEYRKELERIFSEFEIDNTIRGTI